MHFKYNFKNVVLVVIVIIIVAVADTILRTLCSATIEINLNAGVFLILNLHHYTSDNLKVFPQLKLCFHMEYFLI